MKWRYGDGSLIKLEAASLGAPKCHSCLHLCSWGLSNWGRSSLTYRWLSSSRGSGRGRGKLTGLPSLMLLLLCWSGLVASIGGRQYVNSFALNQPASAPQPTTTTASARWWRNNTLPVNWKSAPRFGVLSLSAQASIGNTLRSPSALITSDHFYVIDWPAFAQTQILNSKSLWSWVSVWGCFKTIYYYHYYHYKSAQRETLNRQPIDQCPGSRSIQVNSVQFSSASNVTFASIWIVANFSSQTFSMSASQMNHRGQWSTCNRKG